MSMLDCKTTLDGMNIEHNDSAVIIGGGGKSPLWRQMMADVFACPVRTAAAENSAALGVAILAAVGTGLPEDVRAAVVAENDRSLSGDRAPAHRYTLADYGLSEALIAERFAGYRGLDD